MCPVEFLEKLTIFLLSNGLFASLTSNWEVTDQIELNKGSGRPKIMFHENEQLCKCKRPNQEKGWQSLAFKFLT